MDAYGASDQAGRGMRRVDQVRRGPPHQIRSTCLNPCLITAMIKSRRGASRSSNQDPTDAIFNVFKTLIFGSNRDRRSRSDGHDLIETVHDGPFHRNRQSKRSDGYENSPYKKPCSSRM